MSLVNVLLLSVTGLSLALGEDHTTDKEIEETEEDLEESDVVNDWWSWKEPHKDFPKELDFRKKGFVSPPMAQRGCGACGYISGVQALEARIALVAENWEAYSVQNFMNCKRRICDGVQPYSVSSQVKNNGWIVPENESPFTKKKCLKEGGISNCHCGYHMKDYTNVLDDQFVFMGPTIRADTEEKLKQALQSGPATTCFIRINKEKCRSGCNHANSIIGYNETSFVLQESKGRTWRGDGTWNVTTESPSGEAILKKAYFMVVFYDYDRANAYYEEVEVSESRLQYLKFKPGRYFTENDLKNIGTAKNRCAFLGKDCKGVFETSSGEIKLVSSLSGKDKKKKKKKKPSDLVTYFQKKQMVIYLHNDEDKTYLHIKMKNEKPTFKMTKSFKKASPFFTSYGRIIWYEDPQYHLVNNQLVKIEGDIKDSRKVNQNTTWALEDCNLQNIGSGKSLDLDSEKLEDNSTTKLVGNDTDMNSDRQRFTVGISGKWFLLSSHLGRVLVQDKKTREMTFAEPSRKKKSATFRWNAQQMLTSIGKPFDKNFEMNSGSYFEFSANPDNMVVPKDCRLVRESELYQDGKYKKKEASRLAWVGKKRMPMEMTNSNENKDSADRWTLLRGKI